MKAAQLTAVIVHGNTLVGRCAARAARARGYRIKVADRPAVDTANPAKVEAFARRVSKDVGGAQLLIVCPALSPLKAKRGSVLDGDEARSGEVVRALLLPPMHFAASFGKRMRDAGQGRILLLVSNAAFEPRRTVDGRWLGSTAFSVSMAGVASMTRQLAVAFADSGVLINGIVYGALEGDESKRALAGFASRVPLGRPLKPAELQNSMDLFLDPQCGYVTGQNMVVDGGASIW